MPPRTCLRSSARKPLIPVAERNAVAMSCYPLLIKLARQRVPCGHDADDVAQDAVVRVLLAAADYDPTKGRPGTWSGWKLASVLSCHRRKRERKAARVRRLADVHADRPGPDLAAREAAAVRVRVVLATLPAAHRRVLTWRFLHDMPAEEIGRRLGIGRSAAVGRIAAAMKVARAGLTPGE